MQVQRQLDGYYGPYGGQFVPETLIPALKDTEQAYREALADPAFQEELDYYLRQYVGRESPLFYAERLSQALGPARIYLKREDLNHTGSHKINNTIGQALLAKRMGKKRLIAETGAGQHGVATATAAALFGLECCVYMGAVDVERQSLNVFRMGILGAEVREVHKGSATLKEATSEAFRDYISSFEDSHMLIGSVVGPHPFPMIVRDLQSVIGRETRAQILAAEGRLPSHVIACVGGGSNAMGIFHPMTGDPVNLIGVEAGGIALEAGKHCSTLTLGQDGVLHGSLSRVLQDEQGLILDTHSISAGLDYPGVGPEHAYFKHVDRVQYVNVSDDEAVAAFMTLSRLEGIIPALESAHAVAYAIKLAPRLGPEDLVIINISGRGDKDTGVVMEYKGGERS